MFADGAGKKGGEFYTPSEVAQLRVALLKSTAGMTVGRVLPSASLSFSCRYQWSSDPWEPNPNPNPPLT